MFDSVVLTKGESKVIKKIVRYQLASLQKILKNEVDDTDIPLWSLMNQIDYNNLIEAISDKIEEYEEVLHKPYRVFNMGQDDTSTVLHILHNHIDNLPNSRKRISRKFNIRENIITHLN